MTTPNEDDPFIHFLQPPKDETEAERSARVAAEQEAARISAEIDEQLKQERAANKKRLQNERKVLLLGQESSGKTTCLKQFLLNFSADVFRNERASWRVIVFLNVITSFRAILDALADDQAGETSGRDSPPPSAGIEIGPNGKTASIAEINIRLSPMLSVEKQLVQKLNIGVEEADAAAGVIRSWPASSKSKELTVRGMAWKKSFQKLRHEAGKGSTGSSKDLDDGIDWDDRQDPGVIFNACRDDMIGLWNSPQVQDVLQKRKIDLEDSGGFYLDDLDRITQRRYIPSDKDILNARLRTVGATEHIFVVKGGSERGSEWKLYDVGGVRSARMHWAPFFDDVDAVLFLAPISAFDQTLREDKEVNRLQDSLILWTDLCKNKILQTVPLVLFLNKTDILKRKLASGVKLTKYVPSYGDRPNTYEHVSKYIWSKFEGIKKQQLEPGRDIFIHLTHMTNQETMVVVIAGVSNVIARNYLRESQII